MYTASFIIVISALALIILLLKLGFEINVSLLAGSLVLILYFSPVKIASILLDTLLDHRTLFLLAASLTIALLAELYRECGLAREFSYGLARVLKTPLAVVMIIPALLGLLPIAGGALMSAPIVGAVGEALSWSRGLMIFANVWFRHTLFLFYPLSQGIIVASATSGYSVNEIALIQAPVSLFMVFIGYMFIRGRGVGARKLLEGGGSLARSSAPIIVAVAASIALVEVIGSFGMPIGVSMGILTLAFISRVKLETLAKCVRSRHVLSLTASAYTIMLLQHSITGTGASTIISHGIESLRLPIYVVEVLAPALLGAVAASPITGFIITYPIVASIKTIHLQDVALIYVSSYLAYTASPTHLCMVYTAEYFKENLYKSYPYMIPATIASIVFSVIYLSILK